MEETVQTMATKGQTQTQTQKVSNETVEPLHCEQMLYCWIPAYYNNGTGDYIHELCISFRRRVLPRTVWRGHKLYEVYFKNTI